MNDVIEKTEVSGWTPMFICSSELWYVFILWLSLIYFALTLTSTILIKETRRHKAVSIFYDNLMLLMFLTAATQHNKCEPVAAESPSQVTKPQIILYSSCTCLAFFYLRFYFSINSGLALGVVLYCNANCLGSSLTNGKLVLPCNTKCLGSSLTNGTLKPSRALLMVLVHWVAGLVISASATWLGVLDNKQSEFICSIIHSQPLHVLAIFVSITNLVSVFVLLRILSSRMVKLFASASYKFVSFSV